MTSTPDFYRATFKRSISWQQFAKNTTINAAGVVTGTAGWIGGAAVGSAFPGIGTVAGGLVGGIVGSLEQLERAIDEIRLEST